MTLIGVRSHPVKGLSVPVLQTVVSFSQLSNKKVRRSYPFLSFALSASSCDTAGALARATGGVAVATTAVRNAACCQKDLRDTVGEVSAFVDSSWSNSDMAIVVVWKDRVGVASVTAALFVVAGHTNANVADGNTKRDAIRAVVAIVSVMIDGVVIVLADCIMACNLSRCCRRCLLSFLQHVRNARVPECRIIQWRNCVT